MNFKLGCKGSKNVEGIRVKENEGKLLRKGWYVFWGTEQRTGIDGNDWWRLSQIRGLVCEMLLWRGSYRFQKADHIFCVCEEKSQWRERENTKRNHFK